MHETLGKGAHDGWRGSGGRPSGCGTNPLKQAGRGLSLLRPGDLVALSVNALVKSTGVLPVWGPTIE